MSCELRSLMALLGGLVAGNLLLMPAVAEDTRFAPMALASDEAPTPEPSRGLLSKLRLPFGNSSAPGAAQDTSANTRTTAMVDTNVMPAAYNARGQRGGQFRRTQGQRIGLLEQLTANQGQQTQRKTNNQPQPISSQTSSTRPGRQMPMPTYKQPQYHPNKLQLPEMNQISVAGVNQLPGAP